MKPPHPSCSKLQNFVATMRRDVKLDRAKCEELAKHNPWTTADDILAEERIQANGSRKLPEEVAVTAPPIPETQGEEE
jgi:hypothetical protein